MRLCTRAGDAGTTALWAGARTSKGSDRIEGRLDELTASTPALTSFGHPGGMPAAAALHVARTSCRTAKRRCHRLAADEPVDEQLLRDLNRLADHLFAAARFENHTRGVPERIASS